MLRYVPSNGIFSFHIQTNGFPQLHTHPGHCEFMFITNGKLLHELNGNKYVIEPNSLHFVQETDSHALHKLSDDAEYITLQITMEHLTSCLDWISPEIKSTLFNDPLSLKVSNEKNKEIVQLVNAILTKNIDEAYELIPLLTWLFLKEVILYRKQLYSDKSLHNGIAKFKQLIDDPSNYSHSLSELILITGFSYPHLNRLFLSELGVSIGNYFQQKKLDYAKMLLRCSSKSIQTISELCGFSAPASFSVFFKNYTGVSPLYYRNNDSPNAD